MDPSRMVASWFSFSKKARKLWTDGVLQFSLVGTGPQKWCKLKILVNFNLPQCLTREILNCEAKFFEDFRVMALYMVCGEERWLNLNS